MMKNFLRSSQSQLDEIVFANRNRAYGAYAHRQEADNALTRALFYGLGLFAAVVALPFAINSFHSKTPVPTFEDNPRVLTDVTQVEIPKQQDPIHTTTTKYATFDSTVPTPSRKATREKPAANIAQYESAVAGTQDVEGPAATVTYIPPVAGTGAQNTTTPVVTTAPQKDPNTIETAVDVEAAFAGGVDAFRSKVQNSFDTSLFEGSGETLKTVVTFVVERDGTITNIKATGPDGQFNAEAANSIKRIKGKWSPAILKGQPVRSYFRFPITMAFE